MNRAYYSEDIGEFLSKDSDSILGKLTKHHEFALEDEQRDAWLQQIRILKEQLASLQSGHVLFEYTIPRMGKRADVVLVYCGLVFVIEFKVYQKTYAKEAIDQCMDYALDLKNFQKGSHDTHIVPILVSTSAAQYDNKFEKYDDNVFHIVRANRNNLGAIIQKTSEMYSTKEIDPVRWENSKYAPTPTIIEAARALYVGHDVKEISRSDAGAINLEKTAVEINKIIEKSKEEKKKSICFITGVPGAGKTLAGLNIANQRKNLDKDEHAVFLSGNGPLVQVLQEALARDKIKNSADKITKKDALRATKAFIQNIHHFRDDGLNTVDAPVEKVVVFDEAQRAWNKSKTTTFMKIKKGRPDFNMSEPEFLIKVLDRHADWAVIICLVGGGQEINSGEAGISEWFRSLRRCFANWDTYISDRITDSEYAQNEDLDELFGSMNVNYVPDLHLQVSIRSFRSENVSEFIKLLLDCRSKDARELLNEIEREYPIVMTRSLYRAKKWLTEKARGNERYGITASAKAHRLRPYGVYPGIDVDAPRWFLDSKDDVRSSFYLEHVATEFDVQGLELDWTCVAWDGNFRHESDAWSYNEFRGSKWTKINSAQNQIYLKNTYRVLLTRARQGMVIFIPEGTSKDDTRRIEFYDGTYEYLQNIGIKEI